MNILDRVQEVIDIYSQKFRGFECVEIQLHYEDFREFLEGVAESGDGSITCDAHGSPIFSSTPVTISRHATKGMPRLVVE